jgi:hypothetical protein
VRKLRGSEVEKQVQDRAKCHDFGIRGLKFCSSATIDVVSAEATV